MKRLLVTNLETIIIIYTCIVMISCSENKKDTDIFIKAGTREVKFEEFNKDFNNYISEIKKDYINDYIDNLLLDMKVDELGIKVTDTDIDNYIKFFEENIIETPLDKYLKTTGFTRQTWREKLRKDLTREKLIKSQVYNKIKITDDDIESYYEENHEEFVLPKKYHVLQILVSSKEEARNLYNKLKISRNFKNYAEKYSIAPEAKKGGDLGFITLSMLPKDAQEKLVCLETGKVSNVIESNLGFHLFMITEIQQSKLKPLKDVSEKIKKILEEKKQEESLKIWLLELRKATKVAVNIKDFEYED
jgi:parvulin-like peptidyl-prolyl isomerase